MANYSMDSYISKGQSDVQDKLKQGTDEISKIGDEFQDVKEQLQDMPDGLDSDLLGQLASTQTKLFKYSNGEKLHETLELLLNEIDRRQGNTALCNKAVWWFLIRPEIVCGAGDNSSLIIDLKELLQNGPKYNIHTVLWNGDVKRSQKFQLERTLFRNRISLEMTAEEWKMVNGSELKTTTEGYKAMQCLIPL